MFNPRYITRLEKISGLSDYERNNLEKVVDRFAFRSNEYYLSLINWDDPDDPIRRVAIPHIDEMNEWGDLDVSCEHSYTVAPGCEHKYRDTAVLLVNSVCGTFCRFCFRKRLFLRENDEAVCDVAPGIKYISEHPEINNVLITGGDPLLISTRKLENIIQKVHAIEHVSIIRIGTKIPAFNPYRIINDNSLFEMLSKYNTAYKRIYIMAHFNHPRELTDVAVESIVRLQKSGCMTVNQTPMIQGVNDDPDVLGDLFNELSIIGVPPYYVFICRPTLGNYTYSIPIEIAYEIFEESRRNCSGLAKRARLSMSHARGKIEVVGLTGEHICFKFHRAAEYSNIHRFLMFRRNIDAYWFDDYEEAAQEFALAKAEELLGYSIE